MRVNAPEADPHAEEGTAPPEETTLRLQALLDKLEDARSRLAEAQDAEGAVDVLQDLVGLAKDVQAEIERERREGPGRAELPDEPAG
jgi:hypothetical protein